ncbi:MFS transporter, partial [Blautia sp.]
MKQKTNKMLIFTSLAAYFTYFIHGIGASILGQYKPEFAAAWGAKPLADGTLDVSMVVSVIAALGLGRLISLPFSGPLSDKYGRKLSGIIGVLCYVAYFFGMANSTSMAMGYAFAVIGGIANSFLDTCVSPTCMEIYVNNPSVANLFTKFSICLSQFLLPFLIGIVASANMSYKTIFIVAGIAILIDGILILILPFPAREKKVQAKVDKKKSGHKISPAAIAAILIGFTSSSTFMLWLNCNQELARSYGMADPSKIQSLYALGTATAILATAAFIKKGLKEINVLILYPLISTIMLALCYFIQAPFICLVGGFVIGYAGAGGVLQLAVSTTAEFFPENKGTAT